MDPAQLVRSAAASGWLGRHPIGYIDAGPAPGNQLDKNSPKAVPIHTTSTLAERDIRPCLATPNRTILRFRPWAHRSSVID